MKQLIFNKLTTSTRCIRYAPQTRHKRFTRPSFKLAKPKSGTDYTLFTAEFESKSRLGAKPGFLAQ